MACAELWASLLRVGRDATTGGYRRYSFTEADASCREWFFKTAAERSLRASSDPNGNLWAWWDVPAATAGSSARADGIAGGSGGSSPRADTASTCVVSGSHLDTVPNVEPHSAHTVDSSC